MILPMSRIYKYSMYDFLIFSGSCTPIGMGSDKQIRSIGPHKIADIARKSGYSTIVIDRLEHFSLDELIELCEKHVGPKTVLGVSTTFILKWFNTAGKMKNTVATHPHVTMISDAIEHFRKKYNSKVVIGGPNANWYVDDFRPDKVIRGYAENEIGPLLNSWLNHGIIKNNINPWTIQTCNFKWHTSDCIIPNEVLPLEMSRGCIFNCKFCTYELLGKKKGTYERDLNIIREELIYNFNEFGTSSYCLTSDTLNDNDERMNDWCDMIETLPFKITYTGYARLDLLYRYKKTARRLYDTGMIGCQFGIESFHPKASSTVGKGFNGSKGKEFLSELFFDIFEENSILFGTFIVGLPGEQEDSYHNTIDWLKANPWFAAKFNPLHLTNNQMLTPDDLIETGHIVNSEFSKNSEKYGYRFPQADSPSHWETDIMNFEQSRKLANTFNEIVPLSKRMTNWEAINYISLFKLTAKEMILESSVDTRTRFLSSLQKHMIGGYKNKINSI